ncbi:replication initiator [Nonomuraea sp. NPDC004580]|uniref:replication initiator n=1 Tax=Nonomuraea sp. NPDC004580 TaxID=3154552 RepID=UPI0033AC9622
MLRPQPPAPVSGDPATAVSSHARLSGALLTKSRRYSITLGDLRRDRAEDRAEQARPLLCLPAPDPDKALILAEWSYAGSGHRHREAFWAEVTRNRIATARRIARQRSD